ncbi:hypothetical protein F8S13_17915 [Chloroflexia bacterium SDU3-3]|nr:hypothetical protein F8S13_17915 [Chloroflexia bacterium SDU3-3]
MRFHAAMRPILGSACALLLCSIYALGIHAQARADEYSLFLPMTTAPSPFTHRWYTLDMQRAQWQELTITSDDQILHVEERWDCIRPMYCTVLSGSLPLANAQASTVELSLSGTNDIIAPQVITETQRLELVSPTVLRMTRSPESAAPIVYDFQRCASDEPGGACYSEELAR